MTKDVQFGKYPPVNGGTSSNGYVAFTVSSSMQAKLHKEHGKANYRFQIQLAGPKKCIINLIPTTDPVQRKNDVSKFSFNQHANHYRLLFVRPTKQSEIDVWEQLPDTGMLEITQVNIGKSMLQFSFFRAETRPIVLRCSRRAAATLSASTSTAAIGSLVETVATKLQSSLPAPIASTSLTAVSATKLPVDLINQCKALLQQTQKAMPAGAELSINFTADDVEIQVEITEPKIIKF